mgnify:CR=1 FL=1
MKNQKPSVSVPFRGSRSEMKSEAMAIVLEKSCFRPLSGFTF